MFGSSEKTVSVKLRAEISDYKNKMNEAGNSTRNFGKQTKQSVAGSNREIKSLAKSGAALGASFGLATTGVDLLGNALTGTVKYIGDSIQAASDLQQTVMKANVIFGEGAPVIEKWAESAATSVGLSKNAALGAASSFGDMFKQLGYADTKAASMSTTVVQLAADLGSFNNLPTADVLDMISASFRGEYDSLQRLIPNISAARVENEAMAETGKKSAKELTAQEKATATLAIIQKDGARAQGDFARSSGTLAIEQQKLGAQMDNISAKLGEDLLPLMSQLVSLGNNALIPMLEKLLPLVNQGMQNLSQVLGITQLQILGLAIKAGNAGEKVDGMAEAQKKAGEASQGAARPTTEYKDALQQVEGKAKDAADALQKYNNGLVDAGLKQLDARSAARDYQAALDDASAAIKENGKTLDINTEKGRNNQDALDGIAEAANRQAQQILDSTGSQDAFNASLTQSRTDLYNTARRFGMTKDAAWAYVNQVLKIPPTKTTKVVLDAAAAKAELERLTQDRLVRIRVALTQGANVRKQIADIGVGGHADGGPIYGPGTGTSDSVPALLSNGEHVLTAAEVKAAGGHAAVERLRRSLLAGSAPRFASGGALGSAPSSASPAIDHERLASALASQLGWLPNAVAAGAAQGTQRGMEFQAREVSIGGRR